MSPLSNVQALLFDVFGTVVDWQGSIVNELQQKVRGTPYEHENWEEFALEWRSGYIPLVKQFAETGRRPASADEIQRSLLDDMLRSPRWAHLSDVWDDPTRTDLALGWRRFLGWSDASSGLSALKERVIIGTLSHGSVRLLIDMDMIFSSEILQAYKPDPKIYLGAVHLLDLPPEQVAVVAAHIYDCAAAKAAGLKAVYVRRPTEDQGVTVNSMSIQEGKTDAIVDNFWDIVKLC